jgi:peptide/nickel transport system substrate-binding protein
MSEPSFLRRDLIFYAIAATLSWGTWCGESAAQSDSSRAGTLTIGMAADPLTLDPNATRDTTSNMYYGNMFEGLYVLDSNGQPQPALAVSYRVVDPLTWEFKLRQGIKFHDGTPFDAAAVKFTYERTLAPDFRTGWRSFITPVEKVETPDPLTVRIITKQPFPTLLSQLSYMPIVSPTAVQKLGPEFSKAPVGTGPYKLVRWTPGQRLELERNPDYWRGLARISRVVIRPIPELSTRISELETGGVDVILQVPPDQVERLRAKDTIQIIGMPSTQPMVLQVNIRSGKPFLKDSRVRDAISLAIDRRAVVEQLLRGEATLTNGPVTMQYRGYDPSLPLPAYDPTRARQLLQEANAVGARIVYSTPSGRYVLDTQIAEIVATQLRAVGLDVSVEPLEIAQYVQRLQNRTIGDLVYIGIGSEDRYAGTVLRVYFGGNSVWSQYADPALDAAIAESVAAADDEARDAAARKVVKLAVDQKAGVWLWDAKYLFGINKRVKVQPRSGDWHPILAYEAELTN